MLIYIFSTDKKIFLIIFFSILYTYIFLIIIQLFLHQNNNDQIIGLQVGFKYIF
jgi:hypothetical protein